MKHITLLATMLIIMSMTACSAEGNDPMENIHTSDISLLTIYGARSISSDDDFTKKMHLEDLPAISFDEAGKILNVIKKHTQSEKNYSMEENIHNRMRNIKISMHETVAQQYTFSLHLNMERDMENGVTYFKNYQAKCSADTFVWYIKGFSFASDNKTDGYKFECPGYLYFKIVNDGIQYIQVPVNINGTYQPDTDKADFEYKL